MRFRHRRGEDPDLNLTPLIDVLFLLLIFFMVSTSFQRETRLTVNLPESSGAPLENMPQAIEVTIDVQGRYFVNRGEVPEGDIGFLKEALREAAGANGDPQVILSADRGTPHGAVVRAMDAAGQLGFVHLTIATTPSREGDRQ